MQLLPTCSLRSHLEISGCWTRSGPSQAQPGLEQRLYLYIFPPHWTPSREGDFGTCRGRARRGWRPNHGTSFVPDERRQVPRRVASVGGICLHGPVTSTSRPSYRLRPSARQVLERPVLTREQEAVASHRGGPLLVLAGPGTGKTTTIVEAVAGHIDDGVPADGVLVLTFSRRAAVDLRRRIAERLGRSVVTPRAMTFHGFCYSVVRRWSDPELYGAAPRLLTAPEQEFRVREVLAGRSATDWPPEYAPAYGTRGFAGEVRGALAAAPQLGLDGDVLRMYGEVADRPQWAALGDFFDEYLDILEHEQVLDYAELVHRT